MPRLPIARASPAVVFRLSWQQSYHVDVLEFALIIVLIGALAAIAAPWIMRRRGAGANWVQGNLLVTGVSPKPDATGEQFVTITGVLNGPTVNEHVVYQQLAVDVADWPTMGQLFPVMYAPNNPDRWTFAPPQVMP